MSKPNSQDESRTDWKRLEHLEEEEIDLSETPEPSPEAFARAVVRKGLKPVPRKRQVTLRIDEDILDWFKAGGPGYQSRINHVLRAYT